MSVFTWSPDYGASKSKKPIVKQIKFGDGYEQRATFGINQNPQNWNVKFTNRVQTEADAIEAFFDAQGGVTPFDWTPPDQSTSYKFVCRDWVRTIDHAGLFSITANFEQVFEP